MLVAIYAILVLNLVLIVHELGHFIAARCFGIRVLTAQVGFGKQLLSWQPGETNYVFGLIPLGGRITFDQEMFDHRPAWQRFLVIASGPTANLLLALFLSTAAFLYGIPQPAYLSNPAVVGYVAPHSPAESAGLHLGDRITGVSGAPILTWKDLNDTLANRPSDAHAMSVMRDGQSLFLSIKGAVGSPEGWGIKPAIPARVEKVLPGSPAEIAGIMPGAWILSFNDQPVVSWDHLLALIQSSEGGGFWLEWSDGGKKRKRVEVVPENKEGVFKVGIIPTIETRRDSQNLLSAFYSGIQKVVVFVLFTWTGLLSMVASFSMDSLGGPIAAIQTAGTALSLDVARQFQLAALISTQIGLINLVPLPVLDGGQLILLGAEKVRGKRLSPRLVALYNTVGAAAFAFLLMFVFLKDLRGLLP